MRIGEGRRRDGAGAAKRAAWLSGTRLSPSLDMKYTSLLALAALLAVPAASAQQTRTTSQPTTGQMDRDDDYEMDDQEDLDRLGRDLDDLDRTMTGDMRSDYDAYRQSYDELRQSTPSTDVSDPAAARQARMDYNRRYDELSGNVYRSRLMSARNRNDYVDAANRRVDDYDQQIGAVRRSYDAATGDARADMAKDLIQLRRQRDAYQNQVYSTRGMTRSGFDDAARRRATDTLSRADADFTRARREAMMRSMNGSSM